MSKKILILNGSPRLNGNTAALIDSFISGANESGHTITKFVLQQMNIHPCLGCYGGGKNSQSPCVQKDDMDKIYPYYKEADIVVLASPMYYWSISGQLKCAFDRLFAVTECDPKYISPKKDCIMLMAAEGADDENFEPVLHYYNSLLHHMGWNDIGKVFAGGVTAIGDIKGKPALEDAKNLGKSIK